MDLKAKRVISSELIFVVLSILNTILRLFQINYFAYFVFAVLLVLMVCKRINAEELILYSLFIPQKYLQLLALLVYLAINRRMLITKLRMDIACFIIFITFIGLANCIMHSGSPIQVIFQVVVYYSFLMFAAHECKRFCNEKYLSLLDTMFNLQILTGILQLLYYRKGIDYLTGTFISAHYLGVFIVVYCWLLMNHKKKNITYYLRLFWAVLWLYIGDAKHVWLAFVITCVLCIVIQRTKLNKCNLMSSVMVILLCITVALVLFDGFMPKWMESIEQIQTYVLNEEYNKKYTFFLNTLKQMVSINGLLGFGVGLYGSQIAITMGKGVIHAWDSSIATYHYIANPYRASIEGLMTEKYETYGIPNSSMVLGYPLVSFPAIVGELGLIGFLWFIHILERIFEDCDKTLLVFLFVICIFDIYF